MNDEIQVVIQTIDATVVTLGAEQGIQGPPGPQGPGGSQVLSLTAGAVLSGHRLVTTDGSGNVIYADSSMPAHANKVIGITTGAAASGATVSVQNGGELSDPSFTYTPGAVLYLGTNGLIATVAPVTGFALVIGYAETATKIFIHIGQPITLI